MSPFFPAPSTIVVLSLSTLIFLQDPRSLIFTFSNLIPRSSDIKVPPVKIAISSNIAFLLSPKPGALTATTFKPPLNLFTTKVAKASPSTSSAMINNDLDDWTTDSKSGTIDCKLDNFFSHNKISGLSNSATILSALVIK